MTVQERQTSLHRAPPELWPQLGGEEVRGPTSAAVSAGVADTTAVSLGAADSVAASTGAADSAAVEAVTSLPVPGVQKPPRWAGKRFREPFGGDAAIEGVEAKGGANDIRLAVVEPPGRLPGGQPRRHGLPGAASAAVQAFRRLTATISSRSPT
jgi:hypothetical protein